MVVRKFLAVIAAISLFGCAGTHSPISSSKLIETDDWSLKVPSRGWWFIHRGKKCGTELVGSSYYNVGARPVNVSVSLSCLVSLQIPAAPLPSEIGRASVWMGRRIGILQAFKSGTSLLYTADVSDGENVLTLKCEGDSSRIREVESVCDSMVSSLEFKK